MTERMIRAFLAAVSATLATGLLTADGTLPSSRAIVIGALASGVSACLSLVSSLFGDPDTASFVE